MKKMRIALPLLLLLISTSMFASQMWVVGELFTQTW